MLPPQEALVPSLVGELRSHKLQVWPKKKKKRAEIFVLFLPVTTVPSQDMRCWINTE